MQIFLGKMSGPYLNDQYYLTTSVEMIAVPEKNSYC